MFTADIQSASISKERIAVCRRGPPIETKQDDNPSQHSQGIFYFFYGVLRSSKHSDFSKITSTRKTSKRPPPVNTTIYILVSNMYKNVLKFSEAQDRFCSYFYPLRICSRCPPVSKPTCLNIPTVRCYEDAVYRVGVRVDEELIFGITTVVRWSH